MKTILSDEEICFRVSSSHIGIGDSLFSLPELDVRVPWWRRWARAGQRHWRIWVRSWI